MSTITPRISFDQEMASIIDSTNVNSNRGILRTNQQTYDCSICFGENIPIAQGAIAICGRHIYCKTCLETWNQIASSCPTCRETPHSATLRINETQVINEETLTVPENSPTEAEARSMCRSCVIVTTGLIYSVGAMLAGGLIIINDELGQETKPSVRDGCVLIGSGVLVLSGIFAKYLCLRNPE